METDMTREEAIKEIKSWDFLNKKETEAIETLIPELRESEDEKMTEFEQSVYDLCPVLGIEEAKATASDLLELAKETLLKTGKVVLTSNYPEGCSFEDGFHLGYNEGFNAKQEQKPAEWSDTDNIGWDEAFACVTRAEKAAKNEEELQNAVIAEKWLKEIKFKYYVNPVKPEWSEEDEKIIQSLILEVNKYVFFAGIEANKIVNFLKSLHPQPHWKPSEEQMEAFSQIVRQFQPDKELESLYNDLQKLM